MCVRACFPVFCMLIVLFTGCGRDYEVAQVDGVVLIGGKPGNKVLVQLVPEVGVVGPGSGAETDAQGKFTLHLMENESSSTPGAVVGNHKVLLFDQLRSASATGEGVPIRFGGEYSQFSTTPLSQTIKPGEQSITIITP